MSVQRGRREHDFYPTPGWATTELLARVNVAGSVVEPCVGRSDIAVELTRDSRIREVITNDLDPTRPAELHGDATDTRWWSGLGPFDWVVTNPPFTVAHKILPLAFQYARVGVAMLLRMSYLEPCEGRLGWLAVHPPQRLIVLPRISFTGDGKTDQVTCGWMVWEPASAPMKTPIEIVPDPTDLPGALFDEAATA